MMIGVVLGEGKYSEEEELLGEDSGRGVSIVLGKKLVRDGKLRFVFLSEFRLSGRWDGDGGVLLRAVGFLIRRGGVWGGFKF